MWKLEAEVGRLKVDAEYGFVVVVPHARRSGEVGGLKHRRLGGESVAAPTGKSISVPVRACMRAVVVE